MRVPAFWYINIHSKKETVTQVYELCRKYVGKENKKCKYTHTWMLRKIQSCDIVHDTLFPLVNVSGRQRKKFYREDYMKNIPLSFRFWVYTLCQKFWRNANILIQDTKWSCIHLSRTTGCSVDSTALQNSKKGLP